jgi:hypothetical protein
MAFGFVNGLTETRSTMQGLPCGQQAQEERVHEGTLSRHTPLLVYEKEENLPFWELWTREEKETQRELERLRNSWYSSEPSAASKENEEAKLRRHSYLY